MGFPIHSVRPSSHRHGYPPPTNRVRTFPFQTSCVPSRAQIQSMYDFHVHTLDTLDYLGLDDSHRPPPAATISELCSQAQAAIAGNLANPPRLQASTVSNPHRTCSPGSSSLLATPNAEDEEEYFDSHGNQPYERQRPGLYDGSMSDASLFHS